MKLSSNILPKYEYVLYARSESNQIEIIDDLIIFYKYPELFESDKYYEISEIEYMVNNNCIDFLYLNDDNKLFPIESDKNIINEINNLLQNANSQENLYIENLKYKLNFEHSFKIIKSKSFYIKSFVEFWNLSYPRKIKKYLILNMNLFDLFDAVNEVNVLKEYDKINDDNNNLLYFKNKNSISDDTFMKKVKYCNKEIINIIYLFQSDI